jgi:protoheme ferro-lyase
MTKAILLVNLGSPDSPSVPDVRRYLREFLMDGRVLDTAWPVRFCVVNFAILPSRPKESAHAYEKIWLKEGSPLVVTSKRVHAELQRRLNVTVELAMRYRNPSIVSAMYKLAGLGIDELLLIPLFPHYAMSSFETAVVRVREVAASLAPRMRIEVQPPFYDDPDYITGSRSDTCASPIRAGAIAWPRRIAARRRIRRTRRVIAPSVSRRCRLSSRKPGCRRINFPSPFNRGWAKIRG